MSSPTNDNYGGESNGGSSTTSSNSEYELINNNLTDDDIFGSPIQIVTVTDERKFELDVDALASILLRENIKDTPVVVVSIAGDFRKGKSFMLNHFLRYLQSQHGGSQQQISNGNSTSSSSNNKTSGDWISDPTAPLKGFSWRGGCQRDTTGILMWSEPFLVKSDKGKDVAVILMDTQGAFDSEYTVKDSATVFALSTMISSIQVFNIMHNLQEDNLQVLEIFLEYGRLALESVHEKPFQKLVFLIRDWSYPYEHSYGLKGGMQMLEKKLELKETMPEQLQRVRRKIRDCFREIECFLMPHPGSKVATAKNFDGRLEDYDPEFLEHLKDFVPSLLSPSKLLPKKISGRPVTGRELLEYFKVYINVFAGDTMPEPKTMLEATAEANNLTAVALIKEMYVKEMEDLCGGNKPYINPNTLEQRHTELMQNCLDEFDGIPKMGGQEFSVSYREKLEKELGQSFEHFAVQNKSKNIFGIFATPLILLTACFICFMTARIIELIGIQKVANLIVSIGTMDLALFIVYIFSRYSGNYPTFVSIIDSYSEELWIFIMENIQNFLQIQSPMPGNMNLNATNPAFKSTNQTAQNATSSQTPTSTHFQHPLHQNITTNLSSSSSSSPLTSATTDLHKRKLRKD